MQPWLGWQHKLSGEDVVIIAQALMEVRKQKKKIESENKKVTIESEDKRQNQKCVDPESMSIFELKPTGAKRQC